MPSFALAKREKEKTGGLAYLRTDGGTLDVFQSMTGAITKPNTKTANTTAQGYNLEPGTIGTAVSAELNMAPKEAINRLSNHFPVHGMEPEQKAQMNLVAKLSSKAAEDAKFYESKADTIAGNMASVHVAQTKHKANMFKHDLTTKRADVEYMGAVNHWQTETMSLVDKARERHAGIQLAASVL